MKQILVSLPDLVELSEQEIQALILEKVTGKPVAPAHSAELTTLLGRAISPEELADIRHLIGLYYAERASDLFDAQWHANHWTNETMYEWLRDHMRTAHGRPST